jgi:hypothetical protein
MTELQLLKELIKTENELQEINIRFSNNEIQKENTYTKIKELQKNIAMLNSRLINVSDNTDSVIAKNEIIKQLQFFVERINKVGSCSRLTRNQGMIVENILFDYISQTVINLISDEIYGGGIPSILQFTIDDKNSILVSELSEFLKDEILILNKIENTNFVKLRNYNNGFNMRIQSKFIVE